MRHAAGPSVREDGPAAGGWGGGEELWRSGRSRGRAGEGACQRRERRDGRTGVLACTSQQLDDVRGRAERVGDRLAADRVDRGDGLAADLGDQDAVDVRGGDGMRESSLARRVTAA